MEAEGAVVWASHITKFLNRCAGDKAKSEARCACISILRGALQKMGFVKPLKPLAVVKIEFLKGFR